VVSALFRWGYALLQDRRLYGASRRSPSTLPAMRFRCTGVTASCQLAAGGRINHLESIWRDSKVGEIYEAPMKYSCEASPESHWRGMSPADTIPTSHHTGPRRAGHLMDCNSSRLIKRRFTIGKSASAV
jgi:hypothetical protein